ncbi:MAG TPA: BTAD domain-containing putative transcriptional regulator, partial [Chthonomonadales bacterium]|nr:BTAD domain-containing putative transcriptional regulator [Chthonomonadales bacterium]
YFPDRFHSREELAAQLWPESDVPSALHNLRQAIWSLRRQLEPLGVAEGSFLETPKGAGIRLNPDVFTTDVMEFAVTAKAVGGAADAGRRRLLLGKAIQAYHGPLLPGCSEDWVFGERERLEYAYARAFQQYTGALEERGDIEQALTVALRAAAMAPENEEISACLIRLLMAAGRAEDASYEYWKFANHLEKMYGASPSMKLKSLAVARPDQSPAPRRVRSRRTRITRSQLSAAAPPVSPRPAPQESRVSLPRYLTRFFGREEELAQIRSLLAGTGRSSGGGNGAVDPVICDRRRLVTLVGAGGSGKTRLSVESAGTLGDRFESIYFVPLATITAASGLIRAIIQAARPDAECEAAHLKDAISALRGSSTLLILDNFEQLPDAAEEITVKLLEELPELSCLITSRHRLDIEGQTVVQVAPLPVPAHAGSVERLMEFAAVGMFVDRAQQVRPDFQVTSRTASTVAAICRRVEGIPLAIELAAARAPVLSPGQILEGLTDRYGFLKCGGKGRNPHHDTLRNAMGWSYELLCDDLKRFFRSLAIFTGGCDLDSVRAIGDADDPLEMLYQLQRRSLIVAEERDEVMRYSMLETLREYALEQLECAERAELELRHLSYFTRLAETVEPQLRSAQMQAALERLGGE